MPDTIATARLGEALACLERRAEHAVADLGRMIAVDTSFPPGTGYAAFAALMEARLAPLGFAARRVVVPPELWGSAGGPGGAGGERVNLVAVRRTGKPICSLYFHVDTVPPGEGWNYPPFALTRVVDRLHGRGSADMKGTIAAAVLALEAADAAGLALAYDPELLLCTDEEGGLYPGIRYLAEQGMIGGHVLRCNGSVAPRIWAGCFGSFDLLIQIEGKGGHSGDGEGSRNAIELAVPLLARLAALKEVVEARRSALPPRPGKPPLHARLTIAAAHGGDKGSAVPARFEILLNRRYAPEEDFVAARGEIEAVITEAARKAGVAMTSALIGHLAPVSDPTGPHWPRWHHAFAAGFGWSAEAFRAWGASSSSDMGWVQRAGVGEILLGGLGRPDNNIHGADEFTTVEDLTALARSILLYLAADFLPELLPEEQNERHK
jgi:succinyl-diaminopimelate desuccinylase